MLHSGGLPRRWLKLAGSYHVRGKLTEGVSRLSSRIQDWSQEVADLLGNRMLREPETPAGR